MASLTIWIERIDDVGEAISVTSHYTTDTGLVGSRSVEIAKSRILTGDELEDAIVAEVKRHCEAKWGLPYNPLTDRVYLLGSVKVV